MKIEKGHNQYLQSIRRTQTEPTTEQPKQINSTKNGSQDTIQISDEAKLLAETKGNNEISPRAQEIKKALQNDSYPVSAQEIAEGILKAVRQQKGF